MKNKLKILIFGSGSIGKKHYTLLKLNFNYEINFTKSYKSTNKININDIYNWKKIIKYDPDVVVISNPTYLHIETALKCATLGYKIFLEKPIGSNFSKFKTLLKIINLNKITSYIGYNLRFHPVIIRLKNIVEKNKIIHMRVTCTSNLRSWRNLKKFKKNYSRYSLLGGGVLLDLSHEFDYIEFICGKIKKIEGACSKLSRITHDAEDYANLNLYTEKCIISLHVNFFSHINDRTIIVDFEDFSILADINKNFIKKYNLNKSNIIYKRKLDINYTYLKQFKYFFNNLNKFDLMNSIPKGSHLFEKIIKFKNEK